MAVKEEVKRSTSLRGKRKLVTPYGLMSIFAVNE
jgi:hypothetical protein